MSKKNQPRKHKNPAQVVALHTSNNKNLTDCKVVDPKNRRSLEGMKRNRHYPIMEESVYQVIDWLREGRSCQWCEEQLLNTINPKTQKPFAPRFVHNITIAANNLIEMWYQQQIYQVEKLHTARYNQTIVKLLNKQYSFPGNVSEYIQRKIISDDLHTVLQAMKQKETLLGIHRNSFKITVNNQTNIVQWGKPEDKQKNFILEHLEFDEQLELLQLLDQCTIQQHESYGVILKDSIKEVQQEEEQEAQVLPNNLSLTESYTINKSENKGSTLQEIERKIQERLLQNNNNK